MVSLDSYIARNPAEYHLLVWLTEFKSLKNWMIKGLSDYLFLIDSRSKYRVRISMADESFRAACRDKVECQIYCTGFGGEYEGSFERDFLIIIVKNCSTSSSEIAFETICVNVKVVSVFFRMGGGIGEFLLRDQEVSVF